MRCGCTQTGSVMCDQPTDGLQWRLWIQAASVAVAVFGCSGPIEQPVQELRANDNVEADQLVSALKRIRPDADVGQAHATPIPGLLGLAMPGGNVIYGTPDGRHVIAGDLYALDDTLVNLTERWREAQRKGVLDAVDVSTVVVFPAAGTRRHVLNVFVDVDCEYCRLLQADINAINDLGIEIRYLAYPRAGLDTPSYHRMVAAWCAEDPRAALSQVMQGSEIPAKSCTNAVSDHFALAERLGIPGTPAIVTPEGRLLRGYTSVDELIATLDR